MVGVPKLLAEYDQLKTFPDGALRFIEIKVYPEEFTGEETSALRRHAELCTLLEKQGIDLSLRDQVISILTDFELALSSVRMTNESLNSAECQLLTPTASYLANPKIQSSFLTRYFILCFLDRLQTEVASRAKIANGNRVVWVMLAIVAICTYAHGLLADFWFIAIGAFVALALLARWFFAGIKVHNSLTQLADLLSPLNEPSTCDGRELTGKLRKVERLNVGVPSLVFSLFRITLPGH
jgi:hypothetical protein